MLTIAAASLLVGVAAILLPNSVVVWHVDCTG